LKGVVADFDKIAWGNRCVIICFDINVRTNESVKAAQRSLSAELRARGASVQTFQWPKNTPAGVNGIDDLLYAWGPERVAFGPIDRGATGRTDTRNDATDDPGKENSRPIQYSDDSLADIFSERYADSFRYVAEWGWLHWRGTHWERVPDVAVFDYARLICRDQAESCRELARAN